MFFTKKCVNLVEKPKLKTIENKTFSRPVVVVFENKQKKKVKETKSLKTEEPLEENNEI